MKTGRKYWFSQKYEVKDIGGELMLLPVVSDLSDTDLRRQFEYFFEREDYEYLAYLVAEAKLRGIKLKNKIYKIWEKKPWE